MNKIKYVVGFAINDDKVLFLLKNRGPEYVVGKYNGVGGKIEPGETPLEAMEREFIEETGINKKVEWKFSVKINYGDCILYFYKTYDVFISDELLPEDEILEWKDILSINYEPDIFVDNLRYILPLIYET